MLKLYVTLQNLWADKRGVTAIEYAVLAGAIGVGLIAIFGDSDKGLLGSIKTVISDVLTDDALSSGS